MSDDVLQQVLKAAGADEGVEVRHFRVTVGRSEIAVTLLDQGPGHSGGRYMVELHKAEDVTVLPNYSLGNPGGTVQEALRNAHWEEFK